MYDWLFRHANGIVHRDVKLDNFLFISTGDHAEIKLIDFGFSQQHAKKNAHMTTTIGTPHFLAPQVLEGDYTRACDLWSLGAAVYMMVTGTVPFAGTTREQIFFKIGSDARAPKVLTARIKATLECQSIPTCNTALPFQNGAQDR